MITIGKIREKSGLLIGMVGGALLLFILGEAIRSMGGFSSPVPPRGEVYGKPLDEKKIIELTEQYVSNMERNALSQGRAFTEQDRKQAEDAAYNEVLRLTLLGKEFEALGIAVSEAEIDAYMFATDGAKRSQTVERFFQSPEGGFDEQQFKDFITQAENNVVDQKSGFSYKEFYEKEIRGQIRNEREADKYVTLLQYGTYVTSFEAEQEFKAENELLSVSYVLKNFDFSEAELTDKQFEDYYNQYKNHPRYKQKDAREFVYAIVDVKPSADDKKAAMEKMKALRAAFKNAENDSIFVLNNSDNKFFNRSLPYSVASYEGAPNSYPQNVDQTFQSASVGDVIGPYINGDVVEISKVLGFQTEKQSWVRHILISASDEASFERAQKKADSIIRVINSKNNFVEMVEKFSEDPGSVKNGGEYKWFPEGQMVPEFNDYSFNAPLNKLGTVRTTYGIHIIEVLGRRDARKPYLAVITRNVNPSEETIFNKEMEARDLWSLLEENPNSFDSISSKLGYSIQNGTVYLENPNIYGLSPSAQSQALNFLFKKSTPLKSVNDPIRDGNRFLVFQLTRIINEGAPDIEVARKVMEIDAKKHYLGEQYAKEMNLSNLKQLADKMNTIVQQADVTFKQGSMGVGGAEPKVVGSLFSGLKKGDITAPIVGSQGVYVVRIDNISMRSETNDFSAQKETLKQNMKQSVSSKAFLALMEYADHKDNRNRLKVGYY
jgi:peptidyl-prolyl cis-trans isomerase D